MEKKKIFYYLAEALSEQEKQEFKQELKPRTKKQQVLGQRLDKIMVIVEKMIVAKDPDLYSNEQLAKSLKISVKQLDKYLSILLERVEKFIICQTLSKQQVLKNSLLKDALLNRQEKNYVIQLFQKLQNELEQTEITTNQHYLDWSKLYSSQYFFPYTDKRDHKVEYLLDRSIEQLDIFYHITQIRLFCEKACRKLILNQVQTTDIPNHIDISPQLINQSKLLEVYSKIYPTTNRALTRLEFNDIILILKNHSDTFSKLDQEFIFNLLTVTHSRYQYQNDTELTNKDMYKLHKMALHKGWLIQDNGYIYFDDFLNTMNIAFAQKDAELLGDIECDFEPYMEEQHQIYIITLARAYNFYLHQRWSKVVKELNALAIAQLDDRINYMIKRNLLTLQALFQAFILDKEELEDIPNNLERHLRYIQRKKDLLSNDFCLLNENLVKLLKSLYTYLNKRQLIGFPHSLESTQKELNTWKDKLENEYSNTAHKSWLYEKLDYLQAELNAVEQKV
ncbi:MAG: hypothetical protein GY810_05385 [Aureispira sp.]|nr:hypothetical protein [Aureispira sp.]